MEESEEDEEDDWQVIVRIYRVDWRQWLSLQHTPLTLNDSAVVTQIGFLSERPKHCFTVSIIAAGYSINSKKLCLYNWQRKVVLFEEVLPENSHVVVPFPDRTSLLVVGRGLLRVHEIGRHGLTSPTNLIPQNSGASNEGLSRAASSPIVFSNNRPVSELKSRSQGNLNNNEWIDAKFVLLTKRTERRPITPPEMSSESSFYD